MKSKLNYNHTIAACSLAYVTQAIVNNFIPLLFVFFSTSFDIPLSKITLLVTINFAIQLFVDLVSSGFIDRVGYKASVILADILAAVGLVALATLPYVMDSFIGILIAVSIYAVGGGLLEVVVSPMVEACPTTHKASTMSLLHSFYCWGHVLVVILSTIFFSVFGMDNWRIITYLWAIWPIINVLYFIIVPIPELTTTSEGGGLKGILTSGLFWLMFLLMVCAGASEQAMAQWASAFAEKGLNISKTMGDLLGTLMFAIMMGISRVAGASIIKKISLKRFMTLSSVLCILSYIIAGIIQNPLIALIGCGLCGFSVGIMWPGTYSTAAQTLSNKGTAMFALLALGGDLGCSSGPTVVGMVSGVLGDNLKLGIFAGVIFPIILLIGIFPIKFKG